MREESRAKVILVIDAVILVLGLVAAMTLLIVPSLLSKLVRGFYARNSEQLDAALVDVPLEKQDEIRELTISFTEKLVTYIYVTVIVVLGILFLILYTGITKRNEGHLQCWFLSHTVLLTILILSTVWTLASTPHNIVYHIPDLIYTTYRCVSLIIIREFRTILHTANQMSTFDVRYSISA